MLDGVRVPKEFEPVFKKAEEFVSRYFSARKETPSEGTIEIFGQRYIFVRAAAMSVEFFDIIKSLYGDKGEREALAIARSLLFDIAHAIGIADAREFHQRMDLKDPIEKLSAGPLHFSHSGWAFVDILPESRPTPDENFYLIYDHPYSFESDAWIKAGRKAEFPVCVMNAGYSSGWCEESFGVPLVASEILCRAEGDDCCRFVMAHADKIEKYVREYVKKKPAYAKRIKNYEIPGFFSRKKAEEELRKSEEKYRYLAEEIKDGVAVLIDGKFGWVNKAFCKMRGYLEHEILGKGPEFLLLPEEVPGILRIMENILQGKEFPESIEVMIRRKDGTVIVTEVTAKAINYEGDKAIQIISRDITKRKRDEEKLIMLRNLIDESNDALFVVDIGEGRFLDANVKACKSLGYTRDELRGMNVHDIETVLPDSASWEKYVKQMGVYGQRIHEGTHRRKDGTAFPVEISVSLTSHQGQDFIVAVARDITERKRAEEAIKKSEEKWRSLVENAPNSINIQDRDGTILFINRTLPGFKMEDVVGTKIYDYIRPEYHEHVKSVSRKVFKTGEPDQYEVAGDGPDGSTSWYHVQIGPIKQDEEVVALILITTDITERKNTQQALKESEERFRQMADVIPNVFWVIDLEPMKLLYVSKAYEEIWGRPVEDVLNDRKVWLEAIHPEDRERVIKSYEASWSGNKPHGTFYEKFRIIRPDGETRWTKSRSFPIRNEEGKTYRVCGFSEDITEQVLARDKIERRLAVEAAIAHASNFLVSAGPVDLNEFLKALGESLGFRRVLIVPLKGDTVALTETHEYYRPGAGSSIDEMSDMSLDDFEWMLNKMKNKGIVWLSDLNALPPAAEKERQFYESRDVKSMIVIPIYSTLGVISNFLVFNDSDIKREWLDEDLQALRVVSEMIGRYFDRMRAEKELVLVMKAVEGASDAIGMADPAGKHIYQNKAFSELFEYKTPEELESDGGPIARFVDKDMAREMFGTIMSGGSWSGEVEMLSRSGQVMPVELRGDAVKDENGNIIGLIGIHTEITERKRAEDQRTRMESKIQHMQKLESMGALAGGIAYDFNNLLMGILGNANLALMELQKGSSASQLIQEIEAAGSRAAELSKQMLAYSGKGRFVLKKIDMSNLIKAMSQLIEVSVGREVMVRYDFAEELPEIVADSSQMRQVVMSLITNAAESYFEDGGFVTIKTGIMNCDGNFFAETYLDEGQKPGPYVCVEVTDAGRGMYEQTLEMMFDPFFTTKEKGRGLGLAAVLGIVRGHDGAIKVDSKPGEGTTIRVLFPAIEEHTNGESGKAARKAQWRADGTVLVAEEEESVRILTERMLQKLGFKTLSTDAAIEFIEIFRENADDIRAVVLDMGVPGLNFEEILGEMQNARSDLAIVFTSGFDRTDTVTWLGGEGRIEFIQKPYTFIDLEHTLKNLLEKS